MRDLTPSVMQGLTGNVIMVLLVEIELATGPIRLWSGVGPITWNGVVFTGAGKLGAISQVEDTSEIKATNFTLSLSGLPDEDGSLFASLMSNPIGRRPAQVWFALMQDPGTIIPEPVLLARGYTDEVAHQMSRDLAISVTCETDLIDFSKITAGRYTDAVQNTRFPGDRAFDGVASLQDAPLVWGR